MIIQFNLRGRTPGKLVVLPAGEALNYRIEVPWLLLMVPELFDDRLVCLEYE
jgi:hypothetical protein